MYYLIFDIGGSSIKYGVGDQEGTLFERGKTDCSGRCLKEFLGYLKNIYESYRSKYPFTAIAVSSPGFVDGRRGIVRGTSALSFIHNIPLAGMIARQLGNLPVYMENDGNCGALGEYWKGGWGETRSLAMLVCGSGIGGGYVYHGEILQTRHFSPSEFGFMPMGYEEGRIRPWSYYSVVNITNRYQERSGQSVTAIELFDRTASDCVAYGYTEQFYHFLAMGSCCVGFALDPDIIVVSGAISGRKDFGERLYGKIAELKRECREFAQFHTDVVVSRIGNDANLYGALYHAKRERSREYGHE